MPPIPSTVDADHNENNISKPPALQCSMNQSTLKCRPNICVPGGFSKQPYLNFTDGGSLSSIKTKYESEKYVFETTPSWSLPRSSKENVQNQHTNVPKMCAIDTKQSTNKSGDLKNCYRNNEQRSCQSGKDKIYSAMVRPYICKDEAVKRSSGGGGGGGGSTSAFEKPVPGTMQSSDSRSSNVKGKDNIKKTMAEILRARKRQAREARDVKALKGQKKEGNEETNDSENEGDLIKMSDAEMTKAKMKDGQKEDGNEETNDSQNEDLIKISDAEMTKSRMKDGSEGLDIHILIEESDASQVDLEFDEDGNVIEKKDAEMTTAAEMEKDAKKSGDGDNKKTKKGAGFGGSSRDESRFLGSSGSSVVKTMSSVQREFCNRIKGLSCLNPNATCKEISYLWCANQQGPEICTQTKSCDYEPFFHRNRTQYIYYGMGRLHFSGQRCVSASRITMPKR